MQSNELINTAKVVPYRRNLILAAAIMATFMTAVESTIVATAMPTIVSDLGNFHLFTWVFTAYLLTQAVSVPIYGRLADLFGRKRVFFFGAGLFLIGSMLCGLAPGMAWLIAFRAVQGFGAGAVQPMVYTIVGDIYTPAERARVQGLLSGVFGVAALVGPALGAFLVERGNWPIIFWINLPIGIAAIILLKLFFPERHQTRNRKIDYVGSVLLMVGGTLFLMALVQASELSRLTFVLCLVTGLILIAVLLYHEHHTAEPMLPLDLWRNRVVALTSLGSFTLGATTIGVSAFLPTYVQAVMGQGVIDAGLALGAMSVSWPLASYAASFVMIRATYRASAIIGGLASTVGSIGLLLMSPQSGPLWAAASSVLIGIGMGFCNTTNLVAAQAAVKPDERGAATSSNMFMRIVGQSVGAALMGAIVNAGLAWWAPHSGDLVGRLMDPIYRAHLGPDELARMISTANLVLKNVYAATALFGVAAVFLGIAFPSDFSAGE